MDQDDRPVYSDVGMFTRGRAGYRPDPTPVVDRTDLIVCACAVAVIVALFVYVRFLLPSVS